MPPVFQLARATSSPDSLRPRGLPVHPYRQPSSSVANSYKKRVTQLMDELKVSTPVTHDNKTVFQCALCDHVKQQQQIIQTKVHSLEHVVNSLHNYISTLQSQQRQAPVLAVRAQSEPVAQPILAMSTGTPAGLHRTTDHTSPYQRYPLQQKHDASGLCLDTVYRYPMVSGPQ